MPKPVAMPSPTRLALLAAALLLAPGAIAAQGRSAPSGHPESVVVTAPTVRVRTAPYMTSLSIDDLHEGTVLRLAADDYQSKDWYGVILDGRVAFVPRYAAAVGSRSMRPAAPQGSPVVQAGAPTMPASATRLSREPVPASWAAPAADAPRVASAEPAPSPDAAPAAATAAKAAPAPAADPAVVPRMAAAQPASAPSTAITPAPAAAPAAEGKTIPPVGEPPRAAMRFPSLRLTLGLLGTATIFKSTTGEPPTAHVSGASFVGIRYRALGVYAAPEMGQGAGYKSQMMGGGASLDLLNLHALRITALGGFTTYAETDTSSAPVTNTVQGTSVGGMASLPFFGPLRLAYRGQYVMGQTTGVPFNFTRHSVGLVF